MAAPGDSVTYMCPFRFGLVCWALLPWSVQAQIADRASIEPIPLEVRVKDLEETVRWLQSELAKRPVGPASSSVSGENQPSPNNQASQKTGSTPEPRRGTAPKSEAGLKPGASSAGEVKETNWEIGKQ